MKNTDINSNAIPDAAIPPTVIPTDFGIQSNQASGFRVKPGMTTSGLTILRANHAAEARMMHRVGMAISSEVPGVIHA